MKSQRERMEDRKWAADEAKAVMDRALSNAFGGGLHPAAAERTKKEMERRAKVKRSKGK